MNMETPITFDHEKDFDDSVDDIINEIDDNEIDDELSEYPGLLDLQSLLRHELEKLIPHISIPTNRIGDAKGMYLATVICSVANLSNLKKISKLQNY